MTLWKRLGVCLALAGCHASTALVTDGGADSEPPWLVNPRVTVQGIGVTNMDCRTAICQHNENTDLINWSNATWLVHRTAESQVLGPNSSIHIYRSTDSGQTLTQTALIPAPAAGTAIGGATGRDLRDPHFYIVGDDLYLKALARIPMDLPRDANVDTATLITHTSDGINWAPFVDGIPHAFSFWRIKQGPDGTYYSAAYADGDVKVTLFSSKDGMDWTQGTDIYTVAADTPLETELSFMPSGRMLALVRMDGTDQELLGTTGRLRTRICWAEPPYSTFDCSTEFDDARLDGPLTFFWQSRLFSIARQHFMDGRTRTSLYEVTGTLEGGPLQLKEWGELPSAGDTSYAGAAAIDDHRFFISWYSGDVTIDEAWIFGMLHASDIWTADLDLSKLQ